MCAQELEIRPYLKWAGGKRQLIDRILKFVPAKFTTYYEPFVGAGAVLFHLQPARAVINDYNEQLMGTYEAVRDHVDELIALLRYHREHNGRDYYYEVRDLDRDTEAFARLSGVEKAARLIYLNKTCFNGLYRVNSEGLFNVPYGRYADPAIFDEDSLRAVSGYLRGAEITLLNGDFETAVKDADKQSFVYFDPPYHSPTNANFTGYQANNFNEKEQIRLRDLFEDMGTRGIKCLLSNADTPFIRDIYTGYPIETVRAARSINSKAEERGPVNEVLIRNWSEKRAGRVTFGPLFKKEDKIMGGKSISIDKAWELLFEQHRILDRVNSEGSFRITSTEINTVKEARLMAKFDQSFQLPLVFRENGLSILPVTRGEYIIGSFETHAPLNYTIAKPRPIPCSTLQSLDSANLYNESSALLFAYNSGILQDVLEAPDLHLTVNGRMSSGSFSYRIRNNKLPGGEQRIEVANAQIEIDAGYEGEQIFCICEAKNIAVEEMLVRQLYYPYRLWRSKIGKPIVPLFLVHSNDIFHAFIYRFEDDDDYNSLQLLDHKAYTFAEGTLRFTDAVDVWKSITPIREPNITFPQADAFTRVVDLLSVLYDKNLTPDEVTIKYEFEARQTSYYIAACEYLGLIRRDTNDLGERVYALSAEARRILSLPYKEKYLELIRKILERPVFHKAFGILMQSGSVPDKDTICSIMQEAHLSISGSTVYRRASTVVGWLRWIQQQCGELS
jgi:DNA adenine methylase